MKFLRVFFLASASSLGFGCNNDASPSDGMASGGANGAGALNASGGAVASGGAPGSGGTLSTGGTLGFGGAVSSSGGSPLGSGGAAAGSNGGSNSHGGEGAGGAASGGTAGNSANVGGAKTGEGGASKGGNSGGVAGASTSGGAAGASSDTTIAGTFDGALITYPCGSSHSGYDCDNVGCSNGQVTHTQTFKIGGTMGTAYDLTFRVVGVVEAYNYVGGTRDAGSASITTNPDLFLRGGAPQPNGASGYDYDVYELDVAPPGSASTEAYFLNSVTSAENPHTSSTTLHLSFPIDYTKTIRVQGGGTISVKQYDSNCKSVMNCGKTAGNSCAAPRTIAISDAMPPAPSSFSQPYQMPTGAYGQWLFFDVKSVIPAK
jgi:hypothetical protein